MPTSWIVALAIIAIVVLRRLNESRPDMPGQASPEEPEGPEEPDAPEEEAKPKGSAAQLYDIDEDWTGELGGEEYDVLTFDHEHWTVELAFMEELTHQVEIDAKKGRPSGPFGHGRDADINALLDEGATFIDIGKGANWVSVEFPIREKSFTKARAEAIVTRLLRLRAASK